jgi:nucleoside-diphosphate-sugar epimerase
MKVLVTGGAGFLGTALARALLDSRTLRGSDGRPAQISQLTLIDIAASRLAPDPRVRTLVGSVTDPHVVEQALEPDTDVIFHLAAVVSGQAEADFDLGMRANFDATRLLLERARHGARKPRFVLASSVAVFGGVLSGVVGDDTAPTPQSSYGTQKLLCELLMSDYSRKGFVDGRALRMPTICVRPGAPNRAASSFASGIIREPLAGQSAVCPVSRDTLMWLMSPKCAITNLLHGQSLEPEALGNVRAINMPGLSISVGEMVDVLERFAGAATADLVKWEPDPNVERIVNSWPGRFATPRASALDFKADANFADIIRAYIDATGVRATSSAAT